MNFSQFIAPSFAALLGTGMAHADPSHQETLLVEVFTTTDRGVQWEPLVGTKEDRQINLHIFELDGIQQSEARLSNNLPADPKQSKQVALQRIQQLDEQATAAVQNAAVGLAKAMQYGVDRYPAIVFDGEVVVYGLTDLSTALDHYRIWRAGVRP